METVDFIPIPDSSVRAAAIEKGDVDIAIELNVEDVAAHEGQARARGRVQARHRVRRPPVRLQEGHRSRTTRSSARRWRTPSTRTSCPRRPPAARASPCPPDSRPGCRSTARCTTRTPTPRRTSRRRSSSCRRPATRGRRSSCTAHLVPDRIAQGAVVIQAQLQAAGMNVEVKTLESAALQEVWNKGEFELFYSGLTPRPDADVYYCQTQRVEVEPAPATTTRSTTVSARRAGRP